MTKDINKLIIDLERFIKIQRDCYEPGYMHGMLNGMLFCRSLISGEPPNFHTATEVKKVKKRSKMRHRHGTR